MEFVISEKPSLTPPSVKVDPPEQEQEQDQVDVIELRNLQRISHGHTVSSQLGSNIDVLSHCTHDNDEDDVDGKDDVNAFAVKKTLVQGMMDVALITANANQLRYIIEFNSNSKTYHFVFTMILLSILLQLIVGISLIWIGKKGYHENIEDHHQYSDLCNKFVLVAVFFITIINVFIATFPINGENARG